MQIDDNAPISSLKSNDLNKYYTNGLSLVYSLGNSGKSSKNKNENISFLFSKFCSDLDHRIVQQIEVKNPKFFDSTKDIAAIDASQMTNITMDTDLFCYKDGKRYCVLRFRKNVVDPQFVKKIAEERLVKAIEPNDAYKGAGGSSLDEPTSLYDSKRIGTRGYQYGTIIRQIKPSGRYVIKYFSRKTNQPVTIARYPGIIGKIPESAFKELDKLSDATLEDYTEKATYSIDHSFEVSEKVIIPIARKHESQFGYMTNNALRKTMLTAWSQKKKQDFGVVLTLVELMKKFFKTVDPDAFNAQLQNEYQLQESGFSTVQLALNSATSYHRDYPHSGNAPRYSVLTKVSAGAENNQLFLPEVHAKVSFENGDMLLFDSAWLHGNPLTKVKNPCGLQGEFDASSYVLSIVAYPKAGKSSKEARQPANGSVVNIVGSTDFQPDSASHAPSMGGLRAVIMDTSEQPSSSPLSSSSPLPNIADLLTSPSESEQAFAYEKAKAKMMQQLALAQKIFSTLLPIIPLTQNSNASSAEKAAVINASKECDKFLWQLK